MNGTCIASSGIAREPWARAREIGPHRGRFAPTDLARVCKCGHDLGSHASEKSDGEQPCFSGDETGIDCGCSCFVAQRPRASKSKGDTRCESSRRRAAAGSTCAALRFEDETAVAWCVAYESGAGYLFGWDDGGRAGCGGAL